VTQSRPRRERLAPASESAPARSVPPAPPAPRSTPRTRRWRRAVDAFDARVALDAARLPRSLAPAMWFATAVGYPAVQSIPLIVVGLVMGGEVALVFGILAVSLTIPTFVKRFAGRARPESEYVAGMRLPSPSFPSGHAYSSVVAFGAYSWLAVTRLDPVWAALVVVAAVLGVLWISGSRLFFAAHFGTDILGGWLMGGAVLAIVLLVAA
jgi:undecaprenyl-diphosphatase